MMSTKVVCKDCVRLGFKGKPRPAPYPGPRCATHDRVFKVSKSESSHDAQVARVYNMRRGDYAKLYRLQGGLCAICRRATGKAKRLAVDHNHRTNKVRGLLCSTCNQMLGHSRDDIEFFCRAIRYINRPPADLLDTIQWEQ